MTRIRRRWLVAGAVLIASAVLAAAVNSESAIAGTLGLFALLWIVASIAFLVWRAWRWMTYRVGVRLFISYLMVGVTPFLFAAAFAAVGLWILMGQYTSVRFGSEMRRVRWQLAWECGAVLERAETVGPDAAVALLEQLASRNPQNLPLVSWQASIGGRELRLGELQELPEIDWVRGEQRDIVARHGGRVYGVVAHQTTSGDRVSALIPLDSVTARAISDAWWFDVALLASGGNGPAARDDAGATEDDEISASARIGDEFTFSVEGQTFTGDELWPAWDGTDSRLLSKPSVIWFRVTPGLRDLATGREIENASLLALLRTSPRAVWDDFTLSRYELGSNIIAPLAALGTFFIIIYGLTAGIAAMMIISITRAVKRLSAGARQVELGNLEHRVPVKRRDQLGDLARSFNLMIGSVQSMVTDVAEKERLARELELAREIQESLLPARQLVIGPVALRATFQPATEVGGDYFDVFPMAGDRLLVAIGDVAGHGLSTGLLMAALKSSVAALVHEGYAGAELIERTNRLLMEYHEKRTLATLLVAEIDPVADTLRVANAGHPPPVILSETHPPQELLSSSVPLGSPLCSAATTQRPLTPGDRLVLYSDGLVEATSGEGEPFGYDRLRESLDRHHELGADALIAAVLRDLASHTGGTAADDDLTMLVIERSS